MDKKGKNAGDYPGAGGGLWGDVPGENEKKDPCLLAEVLLEKRRYRLTPVVIDEAAGGDDLLLIGGEAADGKGDLLHLAFPDDIGLDGLVPGEDGLPDMGNEDVAALGEGVLI